MQEKNVLDLTDFSKFVIVMARRKTGTLLLVFFEIAMEDR